MHSYLLEYERRENLLIILIPFFSITKSEDFFKILGLFPVCVNEVVICIQNNWFSNLNVHINDRGYVRKMPKDDYLPKKQFKFKFTGEPRDICT